MAEQQKDYLQNYAVGGLASPGGAVYLSPLLLVYFQSERERRGSVLSLPSATRRPSRALAFCGQERQRHSGLESET